MAKKSTGKTKPKKKSARGHSKEVEKNPIAYTLTDKHFADLEVKNSSNAWWLVEAKVYALIQVFKLDGTVEEACSYAGITIDQYNYFRKEHKNFSNVIDACRELPALKARETINKKMGESFQNSMDYLKRKKRKEFGDNVDHTTDGDPLNNFDDKQIDKIADRISKRKGGDGDTPSKEKSS